MDKRTAGRCPFFYARERGEKMPQQNGYYLDVDVSEVVDVLDKLKMGLLNDAVMEKILHDTCVDTAKYVKTILARTLPKQYAVKQQFIRAGVGRYMDSSVVGNINRINVAVPLSGVRGVIGETFRSRGKPGRPKRGRRKISAKLMKKHWSKLPETMEHQGGNPPFVGKNKIVYTRKDKKRAYPIVRVAGLGLPQMPLNQSRKEVEDAIIKRMSVRLDHHIHRYLGI